MNDTRLLVTSIVRISGTGESSGFVRWVSTGQRRVLKTWPIQESRFRQFDLNPRGGLRGGRGIGSTEERLVIAMTDRLYVFDRQWNQVGELTHPLFGEVHDILVEPDGVWVTATASDALLKIGWDGKLLRSWSWRKDPVLAEALGLGAWAGEAAEVDYRDPRQLPALYDFVHINGVARAPEGLLLSFGFVASAATRRFQSMLGLPGRLLQGMGIDTPMARPSRMFAMRFLGARYSSSTWLGVLLPDEGPARIVTRKEGVKIPNHNLLWHEDSLVFNDTHSSQLVRQAVDGSWRRQVSVPGKPAFARGLAPLDGQRFIVGSQCPAALYELDLGTERSELLCALSDNVHECVYAVHAVPDTFGEPPDQLWASPAMAAPVEAASPAIAVGR
ncbi:MULTISPECIES: hypothetical protein [Corallococcus]|uniref:hypothetical protein n=1 Tax=Corallococcus TaxID=83461 RepID=UPI00117C526D|nr:MULTISPECIES: hypothetical protein [Corallococcus]NBD11328.1 hypothetical protein [Corallococcus silvisoli]TSC26490.1 hypothetical protein FOF48_20585 [Corallococcus sp. Z5C101001]